MVVLGSPAVLRPPPPALLLLAPSLLGLAAFFVLPMLWLARLSLFERSSAGGFYAPDSFTLDHYAAILGDPYFHNLAGVTLRLAAVVTLAAMVLAYPLAIYVYRAGPALKSGVLLAVLLPKLTNLLVAMYGVLVLLANAGPLNRLLLWTGIVREPLPMFANLFAVVVGETLIVAPYPVLILASALHGVDRRLEEAARVLGAGGWRAFYEVPFKLTLPSGLLATLVTFVWAVGAFSAPVVLGNPELYPVAVEVYTRTFEEANWPVGAALATSNLLVVLAVAAGALVLHRFLERGTTGARGAAEWGGGRAGEPHSAGRLRRLPFHLFAALALAYLTAPLLFCLLVSVTDSTTIETPLETGRFSLRWYGEFLTDARWVAGLLNSLQIAALTVPLALLCGTSAALAFERWRFPGRTLLGAAILTPLFVPPVVLGMQSLALHQRIGLWGTPLSIAVAHSLWATPVVFTVMRAALALVDPTLEEAARSLGATPLRAFVRITLPQIRPALVIAVLLAFIVSVNEFVMALFLATPRTQTLPTLIWPQVRYNLTPIVAAASGVTFLITIGALALANRLFEMRRLLASAR